VGLTSATKATPIQFSVSRNKSRSWPHFLTYSFINFDKVFIHRMNEITILWHADPFRKRVDEQLFLDTKMKDVDSWKAARCCGINRRVHGYERSTNIFLG
jgi:hypothetical protein